ncbi:hypothetical protein, partial [Mesorhizobium sp.]
LHDLQRLSGANGYCGSRFHEAFLPRQFSKFQVAASRWFARRYEIADCPPLCKPMVTLPGSGVTANVSCDVFRRGFCNRHQAPRAGASDT